MSWSAGTRTRTNWDVVSQFRDCSSSVFLYLYRPMQHVWYRRSVVRPSCCLGSVCLNWTWHVVELFRPLVVGSVPGLLCWFPVFVSVKCPAVSSAALLQRFCWSSWNSVPSDRKQRNLTSNQRRACTRSFVSLFRLTQRPSTSEQRRTGH